MSAIASQITSLTIVYSTVYSGADQRKHESSASLTFVRGIHRGPVNSPHKWPVTRKMFPFDDVIMSLFNCNGAHGHGANIVVTGDTEGCHNNNLRCHQRRQSNNDNLRCHQWQSWRHHHDNSILSLCLIWLQHRAQWYWTSVQLSYISCKLSVQHYNDVIMGAIASQITSLTIVYSAVYSDADQRKHQSSASLAFVRGLHRGPVNSPHKWPVTRKCFHLMTSSWKYHRYWETLKIIDHDYRQSS